MLSSIPSPPLARLELGPLTLSAYGLAIALGVIAAVWLFGRRLEQRHIGTRDDASAIGVWGVAAGVIGARIYHVATAWDLFARDWWKVFAIWRGGLGIPGGLLAGILAGVYAAKRRGVPIGPGLNAVAPCLSLAQAIGRWGNYFNQELFGRSTVVPWGLKVDAEYLPSTGEYPPGTTFHPTFLYESMWSLALFGLLLWIDKRFKIANGQLLAIYVLGYGVGRLWIESLRVDATHHLFGMRWNMWVASVLIVGAAGWLMLHWNAPRERVYEPIGQGPDPERHTASETTAQTTPR